MTNREDDHAPMLLGNIELPRFTARSASMSMPPSFAIEGAFTSHTRPLRSERAPEVNTVSGPLSRNRRHGVTRMQSRSNAVTPELFGDDSSYDCDVIYQFLLMQEEKCIVFNWSLAIGIAVVRSVTDFIYLLHMILQFRVAYVAPESRVVGAGDLVYQPKKVALNYLRDTFSWTCLLYCHFLREIQNLLTYSHILISSVSQMKVMILAVIPDHVGSWKANDVNNLLFVTLLLQYFPRIIRFVPLLGGKYASGFIFESAWANFVINLLMFVLAGHVVGSCWYLFGLLVRFLFIARIITLLLSEAS
ncbi:hypothetical protein ZIOFF_008021 [Zingiber officinale]|uniref:Ion transport domain-containing protein n=1 Tax=Zingiber officinale TaxID=94328 RepID=A0A8J5HY19_ZINOF|nr:hypothetical protein ZIOFF_008021 [Zingiber officinale]